MRPGHSHVVCQCNGSARKLVVVLRCIREAGCWTRCRRFHAAAPTKARTDELGYGYRCCRLAGSRGLAAHSESIKGPALELTRIANHVCIKSTFFHVGKQVKNPTVTGACCGQSGTTGGARGFISIRTCWQTFFSRFIDHDGLRKTTDIEATAGSTGRFSGRLHGWQERSNQNGNDRDHH